MSKNYRLMTDEVLAGLAQAGDREAEDILIRRYVEMIRGKAHLYFIVGADSEDVIQEGMIGLFKAIHDYSGNREATFKTFAELCINRQILTAVKTASRLKHQPLNDSVSLSTPVDETGGGTLEESLGGDMASNPEAVLWRIHCRHCLRTRTAAFSAVWSAGCSKNTLRARNIPRLQSCRAKATKRLTMQCSGYAGKSVNI